MGLFFTEALLSQGWAQNVRLEIAAGRIVSLQAGTAARPDDERHAIGLPGISNLHSHAFQRGMAGLAEVRGPASDSFWTWREVMYRFLGAMGPEDVEAVAAQAYVEMLEAGFTRVAEFHYLHHDHDGAAYDNPAEMAVRIVAAAQECGIGLTLLPVFYAHSGFGGAACHAGQRRFVTTIDGFARLMQASRAAGARIDGAVMGVAPHSLRAVAPDELAAIMPLADGGPIHIHVAEQTKEVEDCLAWSGARPVDWLLDHASVDRRWCLIHATHMTPEETRRMAATGAVAGLCPITEANLGDGVFNAPGFVAAGGVYGIGTDSNVLISLAGELRQLEYAQRLALRARNVIAVSQGRSTGRALVEATFVGGGRAVGIEAGLAQGAAADIVSLDPRHAALVGRTGDAVLDAWIFAASRNLIDCVWSRGRKVVAGGRHERREAIAERFRSALGNLLAA